MSEDYFDLDAGDQIAKMRREITRLRTEMTTYRDEGVYLRARCEVLEGAWNTANARTEAAEKAIRAMWPIFVTALAYSEHGRTSEHNSLKKLAGDFRNNPPAKVMETIISVIEKGGKR